MGKIDHEHNLLEKKVLFYLANNILPLVCQTSKNEGLAHLEFFIFICCYG